MFRGDLVTKDEFLQKLDSFKDIVDQDLAQEPLDPGIVIEAWHRLAAEVSEEDVVGVLLQLGLPEWAIKDYVNQALKSINREGLSKKVERELGKAPFEWKKITENIEEKKFPLGVLMHIGAGNALGLSAISVMEGLLTGNINILKLPAEEGGVSLGILYKLIEIEPRLKPYIYVINVPSKEEAVIAKVVDLVDAVVVWGGDAAINALRHLTPPTIKLIEWGHRLSFAYFTKQDDYTNDLEQLADEIVRTDQLYCSSPQCAFLETDDHNEVNAFAHDLFLKIKDAAGKYPSTVKELDVQSHITWIRELVRTEEVINAKKLYVDDTKQYSVMVDYDPKLAVSPLFRNIWVMPVKRQDVIGMLRNEKGHLQTVGLSCNPDEVSEMSDIFYSAGVSRVMQCGLMSSNYSGEPHDGEYALERYVRVVNRRIYK